MLAVESRFLAALLPCLPVVTFSVVDRCRAKLAIAWNQPCGPATRRLPSADVMIGSSQPSASPERAMRSPAARSREFDALYTA